MLGRKSGDGKEKRSVLGTFIIASIIYIILGIFMVTHPAKVEARSGKRDFVFHQQGQRRKPFY